MPVVVIIVTVVIVTHPLSSLTNFSAISYRASAVPLATEVKREGKERERVFRNS